MKIHELSVSNIKRVRAVTLNLFDGQHAVLGGRNEQGKSSVLDAIHMALAGGEAICDKPIREGAINGEVTLDLGEIIVTRKFTPKGSTLTVKDKDGNTQSSPQTLLDKLIGKLGFDPLAFSQMDAKAQRDTLAFLAGLDFTNLDKDFQAIYDKRRDLNRDYEKVIAKLAGRVHYSGLPETEVSVESLVKELEAAREVNNQKVVLKNQAEHFHRTRLEAEHKAEGVINEVQRLENALTMARDRMYTLVRERDNVQAVCKRADDEHSEAPTVDTAPITLRIAESDAINNKVRANRELKGLMDESARLASLVRECNRAMDANSDRKAEAIRTAKYPLPGLSLAETCVLINGIPLKQASSKQQIVIGAAINAALNPELHIMIVRGGAFLDENNLVELLKWGTENGIQLFVERVGDGKECSVIIEDGAVLEDRMGVSAESQGSKCEEPAAKLPGSTPESV